MRISISQPRGLRQYTGGHNEEWGGTTLNIDCDVLDGTVSDLRYHWRCPPDEPCWRLYVPGVFAAW